MKRLLFIALSTLALIGCVKDEKTSWDTNVLAPIVNSQLTVSDLLNSDDVVENPDSTLKLVYQTELYSITADSLIEFPDTVFEFGASLQSLELPNDTVTYVLTLGQLARAEGGIIGALIMANHGGSLPIPALSGLSSGNIDIAMDDLFESLSLDSGVAEIIIDNQLPMDITDVVVSVANAPQHGGDEFIRDTIDLIPSGGNVGKEIPVHGKTIYSELIAQLVEMSTPGSGGVPVPIDTNDALTAKIIVKDLQPNQATAIWPEQNVIEETKLVQFAPNISYIFKDAILRDGEVNFEIFSSLQDSIYIKYTVPNLLTDSVNGEAFVIDTVVPPAPPNGTSSMQATFPVDGYYFKLNGYGIEKDVTPMVDYNKSGTAGDVPDAVNAYVTTLEARIQYSGQLKTIALSDTVFVHASIEDLSPEYARGYMGKDSHSVGPDSISFDLFNNVKSGKLDLEDVNFSIEADNGIGASAVATFNYLVSKNAGGDIVPLTYQAPMDNEMIIASALDQNSASTHINTTKTLNSGNSNIDDFVSNLPNKIMYSIDVELNGDDNTVYTPTMIAADPPNFLYYNDGMTANLNMEVPLSFIADTLVLVDTLDFSFNSQGNGEVESGLFKLIVDNGFPFDAHTTLYFMDDNDVIIDSLWKDEVIVRGNVDGITGKVTSTTESIIQFNIDKERMDLLKTATKIYVVAGFHTFDMNDPLRSYYKIYSHYTFGVKLVGDFNYTLSN